MRQFKRHLQGILDAWSWWIYRLIVALELEPFFEKIIVWLDWAITEVSYQLEKLAYSIRTPRVIRDAERELTRARIYHDLIEDIGDGDYDIDFTTDVDEIDDEDDEDGRYWWMADPDNNGEDR